jgi:hypothetical protein
MTASHPTLADRYALVRRRTQRLCAPLAIEDHVPQPVAEVSPPKWHLGHTPHFLPRTQRFDGYFGILYSNDMRPVQLVEDDRVVEYPVDPGTAAEPKASHGNGTSVFQ